MSEPNLTPDDPRDLLAAAGRYERVPPADLAGGAIARVRGRRRALDHTNEFFRIINHLVTGFGRLLGTPPHE